MKPYLSGVEVVSMCYDVVMMSQYLNDARVLVEKAGNNLKMRIERVCIESVVLKGVRE